MIHKVASRTSLLLYAAWLTALMATLGALFIGEVLGQSPCVLCWYQRIAMFPLAWILGVACLTSDKYIGRYVFPLVLIGGLIALWHSLLYTGIITEAVVPCQQSGPSCTDSSMLTVSGLPIPYLSLLSFTTIFVILTILHFLNKTTNLKS